MSSYHGSGDDDGGRYVDWNAIPPNAPAPAPPRFDPVRDIEDFHRKFGLAYAGKPRLLLADFGKLAKFRADFMQEELDEYVEASQRADVAEVLEKQLDALVDLVYVALGTSYLHGFDFREAWRRVHAANMAKVRAERADQSKRGSTYDVVKPPGWVAPSHRDLVEDHE